MNSFSRTKTFWAILSLTLFLVGCSASKPKTVATNNSSVTIPGGDPLPPTNTGCNMTFAPTAAVNSQAPYLVNQNIVLRVQASYCSGFVFHIRGTDPGDVFTATKDINKVYNYAGTYSESFIVELAQSSAPTTVLDMKVVSVQVTVTGGSGGSSGYVVTVTNGSQINYWFNNGYLLNFGPQQVLNGEGASATFGYWTFDIAYIAEPIATSIPLVTRVSFCDANQIMVGRSDGAFNNVTCMTMKPEYFLADLSYHAAVWDLNSHIACPPNKVLVGNTYDATWGPDRPWGTIISHCAKIIHRTN
jgi:hypothetical protein